MTVVITNFNGNEVLKTLPFTKVSDSQYDMSHQFSEFEVPLYSAQKLQ